MTGTWEKSTNQKPENCWWYWLPGPTSREGSIVYWQVNPWIMIGCAVWLCGASEPGCQLFQDTINREQMETFPLFFIKLSRCTLNLTVSHFTTCWVESFCRHICLYTWDPEIQKQLYSLKTATGGEFHLGREWADVEFEHFRFFGPNYWMCCGIVKVTYAFPNYFLESLRGCRVS